MCPGHLQEAANLQRLVLQGVKEQFGGDAAKVRHFIDATKCYGSGDSTPAEFFAYLKVAVSARALVCMRGALPAPSVGPSHNSAALPPLPLPPPYMRAHDSGLLRHRRRRRFRAQTREAHQG